HPRGLASGRGKPALGRQPRVTARKSFSSRAVPERILREGATRKSFSSRAASAAMPAAGAVGEWLERGEKYLEKSGVPESRANAEFLMAALLGVGRANLEFRRLRPLETRRAHIFWDWVLRWSRRVPLAYVL